VRVFFLLLPKLFTSPTLEVELYVVPYNTTQTLVKSFTYTGTTISFLTVGGTCSGVWINNAMTADCTDSGKSKASFQCVRGPCKSSPSTAPTSLAGTYTKQTYCRFYNLLCPAFFISSYSVTTNGQNVTLTPSQSSYKTVTMQYFSDGSMTVASSQSICYARTTSGVIRILCAHSPSDYGSWAETDLQCTTGACMGTSAASKSRSIWTFGLLAIVLALAF
jgi:hypothetical protein